MRPYDFLARNLLQAPKVPPRIETPRNKEHRPSVEAHGTRMTAGDRIQNANWRPRTNCYSQPREQKVRLIPFTVTTRLPTRWRVQGKFRMHTDLSRVPCITWVTNNEIFPNLSAGQFMALSVCKARNSLLPGRRWRSLGGS